MPIGETPIAAPAPTAAEVEFDNIPALEIASTAGPSRTRLLIAAVVFRYPGDQYSACVEVRQ